MTHSTDTRRGPSPITRAEQIAWQRDAAAVLARILELAAKRDLPVIAWTIGYAGARITGHCYAQTATQRRADFEAWREALGTPDSDREHAMSGGVVHLVATWDRQGAAGKGMRPLLSDRDGYQRAGVVLAADIYPDDDDQDQDQDQAAGR